MATSTRLAGPGSVEHTGWLFAIAHYCAICESENPSAFAFSTGVTLDSIWALTWTSYLPSPDEYWLNFFLRALCNAFG